jgi:hypothetical protein
LADKDPLTSSGGQAHMGLKPVAINLSSPFTYEAGATFVATLAYPHSSGLRDQFIRAICRSQVVARALKDDIYLTTPQLIPPVIFADGAANSHKAIKKGIEQITRRQLATLYVLLPYLARLEINGKIQGIKALSEIAAQVLGWSPKSSSNFIDEVWTETRSVAHIAVVHLIWMTADQNMELCPEPPVVAQLIKASEAWRQLILATTDKQSNQPLFTQDEMIQLLPVVENGTLDAMSSRN